MLQPVCRIADDKAREVTESQKSRSVSRDGQTHIFMKMMTRVVVTKTTQRVVEGRSAKKAGASREREEPTPAACQACVKEKGGSLDMRISAASDADKKPGSVPGTKPPRRRRYGRVTACEVIG